MTRPFIPRKLRYKQGSDEMQVDQDFLMRDPRPLIVLGEAGMGKSTLLDRLQGIEGYAVCSARWLINHPEPRALLGAANTLVIDALDEVNAQRDGDAVDLVVRKLGALGNPRFILSCRVADWRSATALQGLCDAYDATPVELHLDALQRRDAVTFLMATIGADAAEKAIAHLEERGLDGLWENPQTLELIEQVATAGRLPESKGELFDTAVRLLRREHREAKSITPLAEMPESEVLDAAGAAFAALILSGAEALSRKADTAEGDLAVAEVRALIEAYRLSDVLDARLFGARGTDRFSYAHRAIGEFLGAGWLIRRADTSRKRRRLLTLFHDQALVPASLRGIHAWLAWHSPDLAPQVIAADPMGVIEYGDADRLNVREARALLDALGALSRENPRFRDLTRYRVGGLVQRELLPDVREVLRSPDTEFGLRLLVLQALEDSSLADELADVLLDILRDRGAAFANRSEAGERLAALGGGLDWPRILLELLAEKGDDGPRLAIELVNEIGLEAFDDKVLLAVALGQIERSENHVGVYRRLQRTIPIERVDAMLDGLSAAARDRRTRQDRTGNSDFTDLAYALIARRLAVGPVVDPARLWGWLEPFDRQAGFQRETRGEVASLLEADRNLQQAIQRYVLLDQPGDKTVWQRSWQLTDQSSGLALIEDDAVRLLAGLDPKDQRWRDIVELVRHSPTEGSAVRGSASRFATGAADADWLARLAEPRVPKWEIEQREQKSRREADKQSRWSSHRAGFVSRVEELRHGDYGVVINPAKAYLKLFQDMEDEASDGPGRLEEWLGPDLRDASLAGFEAFLRADEPFPTAGDIAESHAESRRWDAAYIIVAALAERLRRNNGFDDLPDERLMAGLFEIRHTRIDDHAGAAGLEEALVEALRQRGAWEAALRLYFEPQLDRRCEFVSGLYGLMHEERDTVLATALAGEWLQRHPNMAQEPEVEMIDRLLGSGRLEALRLLARDRRAGGVLNDERRRNWDAVALITDFQAAQKELAAAETVERELLWHLRARLGDRRQEGRHGRLDAEQLAWTIAIFRPLFPATPRPNSVTTGDTNAWDAADYIGALVARLGEETRDEAIASLAALRDAPADGYTGYLRVVAAEQRRKRIEKDHRSPSLATIASVVADMSPTTPEQLQAVVLEELDVIQRKLKGSDVDWYIDFLDGNVPRIEDRCRDALLKMLRPMPFEIQALPEGHLADDKRCDIVCLLPKLMVPIEIKGQWHRHVWTAADCQLDQLYVKDWQADRGIFLALWFGTGSHKPPTQPPTGMAAPATAEEFREELTKSSVAAGQGRVQIVVLDLTRPT